MHDQDVHERCQQIWWEAEPPWRFLPAHKGLSTAKYRLIFMIVTILPVLDVKIFNVEQQGIITVLEEL